MKTKLLILSIAALCIFAGPARADVWAPPGVQLQTVFDTRTLSPTAGDSSIDVTTDYIPDLLDSYWSNTGGGSVATIVVELGDYENTNKFGIYDSQDEINFLQVFAGGNVAGHSRTIFVGDQGEIWLDTMYNPDFTLRTPDADFASTVFGFYLDSTDAAGSNDGVWYSDTLLNSDNSDHMFSYQGQGDGFDMPSPVPNAVLGSSYYFLAWEDLNGNGADWNYTDMVVLIESVQPVPVPAAVLLGMLGLSLAGLKLRKFA